MSSENHDSEVGLDGCSAAAEEENGGGGSNGFVEPFIGDDAVNVVAQMDGDKLNQEPNPSQDDHVDQTGRVLMIGADTVQVDPNDVKVIEDGGKEDMFVDCSEELVVYGREATEIPEIREKLEEKDDVRDIVSNEPGNGMQVPILMGELQHLRTTHEKTVSEKEEYEEEKSSFMKELANVWLQLKALNEQQLLLDDHNGVLVGNLRKAEVEDGELKSLSDTPLDEMVNECSKFIKHTLDERSRTEGAVRDLHGILYTKDQEIADLKVQIEKDQHIEDTANRVLSSLATVVDQELFDESVSGKIDHVEKSTSLLIEKYARFLSEIDLLRQCLAEVRSDPIAEGKVDTVFFIAREELLELKRKEIGLAEKISHLEEENGKLMEQLEKERGMVKIANTDLGKLRGDLDQEKARYSNTKEKLSMAVTKGKALVQQRDSLKHSLADRTSELEKCLLDLQEKSSSLEDSEIRKEELLKSETLAASLQEALSHREMTILKSETLATSLQEELSHREMIIEKCEEILSQTGASEELKSNDIIEMVRWVAHERNALVGISLEFQKLVDALSLSDLPETMQSSSMESCVSWLLESFDMAKDEVTKLQAEIARTREVSDNEIDRLTESLLAETQEKNYLLAEFEDLTTKFEKIVKEKNDVSVEKDRMVGMLLETTGVAMPSHEEVLDSEMAMIVDRCFGKIKAQTSASVEFSHAEVEVFERIQNLLYIRTQDSLLYEKILEEELSFRSEVNRLSDELVVLYQELRDLKDEKGSLQNDHARSEEKAALLRDKLSRAVKKGKGLVQDKENLKQLLGERNSTIEKLKLELQQQESELSGCKDQINRLSAELERIPKLEADIGATNDQRDQLERFLVESNSMLQRVIESMDAIVLPFDSIVEEPVEKVKCLAQYFNQCQLTKTQLEQELGEVKDEVSNLSSKLTEAQKTMKSLEDELSVAENSISHLTEEKRELDVALTYAKKELQKAKDETSLKTSKFDEVCASRKSLKDALSIADNNISVLVDEKEDAHANRIAAETELQKVKEEVYVHTSKLAEAYKTIQSLEDAISQVQSNVSLLAEENNKAQVGRTDLEKEIHKLRVESDSKATELVESSSTIKSLEDALLKAENTVSDLVSEKKKDELEISTLNSRLNACMEELAGTHGSIENSSLELSRHLSRLHLLLKDDMLLSLFRQSFKEKFESLKGMDHLLEDVRNHFIEMEAEIMRTTPVTEENTSASHFFPDEFENVVSVEMVNGELNASDGEIFTFFLGKAVEEFYLRNKILADNFENFSAFMNKSVAVLVAKLQSTRDKMTVLLAHMKSLKQCMLNMEMDKEAKENTIAVLENNIETLFSACVDSTRELEYEVEKNLPELSSFPELEKLSDLLPPDLRRLGGDSVEADELDSSKYVQTSDKLVSAARNVRNLIKQFHNVQSTMGTRMEDLQNKLKETSITCEKVTEQRDLQEQRIFKLEADLEALQNLSSAMRLKLEDFQAKEDKLREREAELASLHTTSIKEQEPEKPLLSASEMKTLFDKMNGIGILFPEFEVGVEECHNSVHIRKLLYVIDSVDGLQHQTDLLSHENEQLQSNLEKQALEIQYLKDKVLKHNTDMQESVKMKKELYELSLGLEKIIKRLGDDESAVDQKSGGAMELLPVIDKLIMEMVLETEASKSEVQELGAKLLRTQEVVDELSSKVKLLEEPSQGRTASPECVQETGVFEAPSLPTRSEISEIEDVGPLGIKTIPSTSSAAHARTLRKGSSDHLAINIDSESERLINNEDANEDKGHVFKSLNTSGLVPRQGKMIADRVDGIWVSGDKALMSRPRARLGLIAYWLFLNLWLLGTIL